MTEANRERLLNNIKDRLQKLCQNLLDNARGREPSETTVAQSILTELNTLVSEEDSLARPETERNFNKIEMNRCVRSLSEKFYKEYVLPTVAQVSNASGEEFLAVMLRVWDTMKVFALSFRLVLFKHLQFYFHSAPKKINAPSIPDIVVRQFRTEVVEPHREKIRNIIISTFESERDQGKTDKESIKALFQVLRSCGMFELTEVYVPEKKLIMYKLYQHDKIKLPIVPSNTPAGYFRDQYLNTILDEARRSYKIRAGKLSQNPAEYISQTWNILRSEEQRAGYYIFEREHQEEYLRIIEIQLIDNMLPGMLRKPNGLKTFIDENNAKSLTEMYRLAQRRKEVNFQPIQNLIEEYFMNKGNDIANAFLNENVRPPPLAVRNIHLKNIFSITLNAINHDCHRLHR